MVKKKEKKNRQLKRTKSLSWYQYNTFRTKIEYYTQIVFPENKGDVYFSEANVSWKNFASMINASTHGDTLRSMFSYLIVNGVKVEVIPFSTNTTLVLGDQIPVVLAFVAGTANNPTAYNFNDLNQLNTSFMLDPVNKEEKYFSFRGATRDLKLTADNNAGGTGGMKVIANGQASNMTGNQWNMKVTLYVYWRFAKIV